MSEIVENKKRGKGSAKTGRNIRKKKGETMRFFALYGKKGRPPAKKFSGAV